MVKKTIFISIFLMCYLFGHSQEVRKCDCDTLKFVEHISFPEDYFSVRDTFVAKIEARLENNDAINGEITIEFWINSAGTTSEHKIIRGIRKEIDEEILEMATHIIYKQLPKSKRGHFGGVCAGYTIKFGSSKKKPNCWQRFFDFVF